MTVALDVEGLEAQHHVAEARRQGKDPVTVVLRHVQRDDQDGEAVARVVLQQGDQGHRQMLAVGAVDTENELDGHAVEEMRRRGSQIDPAMLSRLSPLGWDRINLTGDYVWSDHLDLDANGLMPLLIK